MHLLLAGLGTMFGFIGFGIAIDLIFNDGESIQEIIEKIKE